VRITSLRMSQSRRTGSTADPDLSATKGVFGHQHVMNPPGAISGRALSDRRWPGGGWGADQQCSRYNVFGKGTGRTLRIVNGHGRLNAA
jgi:hypothetical protein